MSRDLKIKRNLFYKTTHSPSLVDMVGFEQAKKITDFCFIANPYYPTQKMLKELQLKLPGIIKSYPSSQPRHSQEYLAKVLNVNPDHLVIGNGASELIAFIEETLIKNIGIPVPTFSEYLEKLRNSRAAKIYFLSSKKNYQLDLTDYLSWIHENRLKSALIINPGNPTGQFISEKEMVAFLEKAKDLELVIVDESFIDFSGTPVPSLMPIISRYENLLIVRSMSKHCGVPGIRLGYCCTSNQKILKHLRHVIPVWNINGLAEYFLSMLSSTDREYHQSRIRVISDMRYLYNNLKKIKGFFVYPTGCNFILVRIENGMTAAQLQMVLLDDYRLYVRDCTNKIGLDNRHVRIATQGKKKDMLLIKALTRIMKKGTKNGKK